MEAERTPPLVPQTMPLLPCHRQKDLGVETAQRACSRRTVADQRHRATHPSWDMCLGIPSRRGADPWSVTAGAMDRPPFFFPMPSWHLGCIGGVVHGATGEYVYAHGPHCALHSSIVPVVDRSVRTEEGGIRIGREVG